MMCLFVDLSHCLGIQRRTLNPDRKSKQITLRGRTCIRNPRQWSKRCVLYRDSRSNPIAAILSQRCQPFVTRIVLVFENDAPNR
jgi:hypothetical protein